MAFDQNSVPQDLRPLNVPSTMATAEEPLISPAATAATSPTPGSGRDIGGSPGTPPIPLFYSPAVSDATAIVGLSYGNVPPGAAPAAATWCVRPAVPIANPTVNPAAIGFSYGHSCCNRVAPGNALNLGNWVGASSRALDKACNDAANGFAAYGGALRGNRVVANDTDHAGSGGHMHSAGQLVDHVGEDGVGGSRASNESVSGRKVKFLCSFGGKILPRPSDGMLRYVGGKTRIISVRRDVSFNDLMQKMIDTYGQPVVIKYQLPEEELDALVSVSCPDDVEHMMEEYEKLMERSPDGSAKLRVFLFSASELDLCGGVQFGDLHDSGLKYVEVVNGIADGVSIGITRKESVTSAASTQNSDLSAAETLDSLVSAQGDVSATPKGNVAASTDTNANSVVSDAVPAVNRPGASGVSLGMLMTKTGPTHTPCFQNEVELEKSLPVTLSHHTSGLQQSGMDLPPSSPYLQPFVDSHQEVMNHADYVHLPPQMGFPNAQLLAKSGHAFTQHQFHDNTTGLSSHQVIPGVQMTIAQPYSQVGVRANVIQSPSPMQLQQNCLDQYNDENTSGLRFVQLPAEHGYNTYQVPVNHVPSVIVGGNYGWVQVPPQEHVVFSDGLSSQQQVMIPDNFHRVEDCSMCQTKLPHAHSDPVVQDQCVSGAGPIPDSVPGYHSFPMEDNPKAQATNRVMLTAPLKESTVDPVSRAKPQVIRKLEPPDGVSCTEKIGLSHNLEPQPEGGRIFTQKLDGSDYHRNSLIQETIGRTSGKQSPKDGFMGTAPLSYADDVPHQHMVPVENSVTQDSLVNKAVHNNLATIDGTAIRTSEYMAQRSPKEYTTELSGFVSNSDSVDTATQDHLKPTDGRMDTLNTCNPEIYVNNDRCFLPADKSSGSDKVAGVLPSSSAEISYGQNTRPGEYNEVAQPTVWGIPGLNPQSKSGNHHKDDAASSVSSPVRFRDVHDSPNSLFSNQDPWTIHHGTFLPPVRPNNATLRKENYSYVDHFGENPGNSVEQNVGAPLDDSFYQSFKQNLTLEHIRCAKGSAEDQQLQAVAEDVAASVLHSRVPSNPDLHAGDVSCGENIEDGDDQNHLADIQSQSETQNIKSKPPEMANFGFPVSDVGGLQVIKNCDLEELTELGSGTFGTVYHGKWRGTDVAIKRITDRCFAGKPSEQERMRADFWNEAIKLADLHHPNVVAFYGVVLDGPGGSVATVTEYMANGSLRNALLKNGRNLDKRRRLMIAMDVAFGMEYLHGKNIVHFDLKSDNLLVNLRDPHRPICKVGDLGLSKVKRQTLISGGVRGTLPWMAPELLNGSSSLVSEKVDVFSFGIVMWELLTGEEPYADLHYGAIIGGIVSNTLRPPVPEPCDSNWRLLMERCWSSEPSERPSFTEIASELRSMASKISPKGQNQQQQPLQVQK